jgi:hypothetical protein
MSRLEGDAINRDSVKDLVDRINRGKDKGCLGVPGYSRFGF